MFREFLSLSFLFGTGSSICLGADHIRDVTEFLRSIPDQHKPECTDKVAQLFCEITKQKSVEDFLAFLNHLQRAREYGLTLDDGLPKDLSPIAKQVKSSLIERYRVPAGNMDLEGQDGRRIGYSEETRKGFVNSGRDPLWIHKHFIRRIVSRPTNLQRVNIFTTNYDLAFEKALDGTGTLYIDGFVGGVRRFFRPHCFNHDLYYPQAKTEGEVHRLEELVHLYKIHGSLD